MRVGDGLAAEFQRHLLGAGIQRFGRDVEAHARLRAAAGEEQLADGRCALELRQVAGRDRRRHAGHRLRLPDRAGGIDERPKLRVEERG